MALIEGRLVSTKTTSCLLSSAFVRVALSVFNGVPSIWASESGTVLSSDRIAQQVAQIIWVSVQEISNVYKIACTGHSVLEVLPLALWVILLGLLICSSVLWEP